MEGLVGEIGNVLPHMIPHKTTQDLHRAPLPGRGGAKTYSSLATQLSHTIQVAGKRRQQSSKHNNPSRLPPPHRHRHNPPDGPNFGVCLLALPLERLDLHPELLVLLLDVHRRRRRRCTSNSKKKKNCLRKQTIFSDGDVLPFPGRPGCPCGFQPATAAGFLDRAGVPPRWGRTWSPCAGAKKVCAAKWQETK